MRLCGSVLALMAAMIVAGCGSSSPTGTSSPAESGSATRPKSAPTPVSTSSTLAFAKCIRSHGVPAFPDLGRNGMRIAASGQTISINGVSLSAAAFSAARQKCQQYTPHTHASPVQAAQQRQRGLKFARCMRSHGVPTFPDPQLSADSGGNEAARLPGVTDGELQAPAFQAAAKACGGGPKGP